MFDFLIRRMEKRIHSDNDMEIRKQFGYFAGWTGVVLNASMAIMKFLVGLLSSSVAIMADAVNNLADTGSSAISVVSFKLSAKKPDKEHPFGHARFEYILSSVLALIIMFVGAQFLFESFRNIMDPPELSIQFVTILVLSISILLKLWLFFFYRILGRKISSEILEAAASDSISDVLATTVVLLSIFVKVLFDIQIDGIIGIVVALIIIKNGYDILKHGVDLMVGKKADQDRVEKIRRWIFANKGVLGVHDLIVHDYGPGHLFVSVHIEVDSRMSLVDSHDLIDTIENGAVEEFGWQLVIHVDPLDVSDPELQEIRNLTEKIVEAVNPRLSIHDFRIIRSGRRKILVFDCDVPNEVESSDNELKQRIQQKIDAKMDRTVATITFDHNYVRGSQK